MNFNVGKLYQVKKLDWLLYPTKDIAAAAAADADYAAVSLVAANDPTKAAYWLDYLSKYFNCNVTYISPNSIFCLIEKDGNFLKILSTNGELGWMIYRKNEAWAKNTIEQVNQNGSH